MRLTLWVRRLKRGRGDQPVFERDVLVGDGMPVLELRLDTRAEAFAQNRADMLGLLATVDGLLEEAARGGGEKNTRGCASAARCRSASASPCARPRLAIPGDQPLAAWRSTYHVGSGFVVGIGVIVGVECVILGHDPSVRAGAFNAVQRQRSSCAAWRSPRTNRMPYVQFVESAGADLSGGGGRR